MTYWPEETTPAVVGGKGAQQAVSPKPPPKAPSTYWEDPEVENASETGKGKDPNGKDGHGGIPNGRTPKEMIPNEMTQKGRMHTERIPTEERHCRM